MLISTPKASFLVMKTMLFTFMHTQSGIYSASTTYTNGSLSFTKQLIHRSKAKHIHTNTHTIAKLRVRAADEYWEKHEEEEEEEEITTHKIKNLLLENLSRESNLFETLIWRLLLIFFLVGLVIVFSLLLFRLLLLLLPPRFVKVSVHTLIVCVCVSVYYRGEFKSFYIAFNKHFVLSFRVYCIHNTFSVAVAAVSAACCLSPLPPALYIGMYFFSRTWFCEASICTANNSYSSPTNPLFILITLLYIILISFISFTSRINNYSFVHGKSILAKPQ